MSTLADEQNWRLPRDQPRGRWPPTATARSASPGQYPDHHPGDLDPVTANQETKAYGTADPALTDSVTGLVNTTIDGVTIDDTTATVLSGALARAQFGTAAGERVGDYAITLGTLAADSNYTIAFTGSTVATTPAALSVAVDPQTKVYGTTDPALTCSDTVAASSTARSTA